MRSSFIVALVVVALALCACRASTQSKNETEEVRVPRIGIVVPPRVSVEYETHPTPLVYGGGFLNKAIVFETLVDVDHEGAVVPRLATSWSASPDARRWTFELAPGRRFHSGAPVDAAAVRTHFLRFLGDPEDEFIPGVPLIESIEVRGPLTIEFLLREPTFLPPDLAIVNPMAIVGPGAERGQDPPVLDGSGPWRIARYEPMESFRFERNEHHPSKAHAAAFELHLIPAASPRDAIGLWALRRGRVDALVEDWVPKIPRHAALALAETGEFVLERVAGSATRLLVFNTMRGPFELIGHRATVFHAIDRQRLIDTVEAGLGQPARSLFAPTVENWPSATAARPTEPMASNPRRSELLVTETNIEDLRAALLVKEDLARIGYGVELVFVSSAEHQRRLWSGEFDLAFAWTWGAPYDPRVTLQSRFLPPPPERTAVETPPYYVDEQLTRIVESFLRETEAPRRAELAIAIESRIVEQAAVVPLYVPDRVAVRRPDLVGLDITTSVYSWNVDQLALEERD